ARGSNDDVDLAAGPGFSQRDVGIRRQYRNVIVLSGRRCVIWRPMESQAQFFGGGFLTVRHHRDLHWACGSCIATGCAERVGRRLGAGLGLVSYSTIVSCAYFAQTPAKRSPTDSHHSFSAGNAEGFAGRGIVEDDMA